MARTQINASFCLAGLIACLSAEGIQAGSSLNAKTNFDNKLYHERARSSQIEEWFRKLPSIENEVDSLFDDASFLSAFGSSPHANDENSDKEIEELFSRILVSQESGRDLSYLSEQLETVGASGVTGAKRTRSVPPAGAMNAVPGLSDEEQSDLADEFAGSGTTKSAPVIGKSNKSGKSGKTSKNGKDEKGHKSVKKGKRYKDESKKVSHKLQKSGKKDPNFSYDPNDGNDDHYEVAEDFHFDNWEWEFVDEESEDMPDPNPMVSQNGVGGMMGRMDGLSDEGYTFSDSGALNSMNFQPVANTAPVSNYAGTMNFKPEENSESTTNYLGAMNFEPVENSESTSNLFGADRAFDQFEPVEDVENGEKGEPVGRPLTPITLMSNELGQFKFNFPSIQHTVFSGPIHLKAHSITDLSTMDPEIFDVLQSILTPYLEQTMGESLHAYNLEIDYAPGRDDNVGSGKVVTLMEVKCTYKVVSDSIESFRSTNHDSAKQWLVDFFTGPARYNIKKLIEALQSNNIPVDDIVLAYEEFDMGNIVLEANSQSFGKAPSSPNRANKNSPSGAAMVCITLSVLFAGILFFMHYTGRLPSKAEIGEFSLNTRDSIKHHSINARDSIRSHMPTSIQLGKKRRGGDDNDRKGGRRKRRTFSGTFRRFPTGGLQKAAIQKKPAKSEQYIGDSESTSHKLSRFEDYSFSHYGGDYGPSTPSRQSSIPPMTQHSRQSDDEFSMPDTYDSLNDRSDRESLLDKVGNLMSPKRQNNFAAKSPIPSRAPRRVTANDIASPNDVDNWSIDSYETPQKSPSDRELYRGWNESGTEMRRPIPRDPPDSRHERLSLPFFS